MLIAYYTAQSLHFEEEEESDTSFNLLIAVQQSLWTAMNLDLQCHLLFQNSLDKEIFYFPQLYRIGLKKNLVKKRCQYILQSLLPCFKWHCYLWQRGDKTKM